MAAIPLSHAYGLGNLRDAGAAAGHGDRAARVLRPAAARRRRAHATARRCSPACRSCSITSSRTCRPAHGRRGSARSSAPGRGSSRPPSRAFLSSFGVKIHSFYGTSETGGIAYDDSAEIGRRDDRGPAAAGVTVTLLPEEGAPPGGGRVHVAGPRVSTRLRRRRAGRLGRATAGLPDRRFRALRPRAAHCR